LYSHNVKRVSSIFPVAIEFQLLRVFCLNLYNNNFKGIEMKKIKIGIIGAGSNEVKREIERLVTKSQCNCPMPIGASNLECDPRLNNVNQENKPRKHTYSGTFIASEELRNKLASLADKQVFEVVKIETEPKETRRKSPLDFEKPKSIFHK